MTVVTFSPNELQLTMTDRAVAHFQRKLTNRIESAIRLWVKESGCSGYKYEMDFVDSAQPGDKTFEFGTLKVFVSEKALPILLGTEIDLVKEGVNSSIQFKNPNAKAMCGCGESFTV